MGNQRTYRRPKTRDDMHKLFEQTFYEVRHWYALGNGDRLLLKHIKTTFGKRPSKLTTADLAKANTMTFDEWMKFARTKYDQYLECERERIRKKRMAQPSPFGEAKPLPVSHTPTDENLPGFENEPRQAAIDFETAAVSDNIGQLVIEVRHVAEALEKLFSLVNDKYNVEPR